MKIWKINKKRLLSEVFFYLYTQGAMRLSIKPERRSKMSQMSVFIIFSFDWLLNFWSTHHIVYCIPLITMNNTHPSAARKVKYFIIHHIIVSTQLNQVQTSHEVVHLSSVTHPSQGIFSVTTTLIAKASQLMKKREIIIKKDKNIFLKSFICNYFIN